MRGRHKLLALAFISIVGWLSTPMMPAAPSAPQKAESKAPIDDRDDLMNKLMDRITIDKPMRGTTLRDVLAYLDDRLDLTILVDYKSFDNQGGGAVALNADEESIINQLVTLPAMKNVRVATILKNVADQIDAVYLLEPDHIKFVSLSRAETLTRPAKHANVDENDMATENQADLVRSVALLNVNLQDKPLQDALREVESRTNRTIVLAPQSGDRGKTPITTRFTNVPVETAVAALAEMAGLKMARKGNVLLVTTEERAKAFDVPVPSAPAQNILAPCNPLGGGFFNLAATDANVEELKKKIASLEKALEEIKKEKVKN